MKISLARALVTVSALTLVSRVAGFIRDILAAALLGAGPAADAFFVALKLPNLFRRLFAEGALSVSFVPVYSAALAARGPAAAHRLAEEVLAVLTTSLLALVALALPLMDGIIAVIAPGFADQPGLAGRAASLARITFPYLILVSLSAFLGGVLNAHGRFAPFAAMPVLLNLFMIAALLASPYLGPTAEILAYAVTLAGLAQLCWMAACARAAGLVLHLRRPRLTPQVRHVLKLMGPGAIGAGVMQINVFFDVLLATLVGQGAVSFLYYADRLYQLPLGVVGIALGTALLPMLSAAVGREDGAAVRRTMSQAILLGLLLSGAAAIGLAILAEAIIAVLFERGAFTAETTAATAAALRAYALGIPAFVLVKILAAAYFARQDTAGPVRVAIITTTVNIALSLALIGPLGHVGIALATGLTAWLNVALLLRGLRARGWLPLDGGLAGNLLRLLGLCGALALALGTARWLLMPGLPASTLEGWPQAAVLGATITIAGGLYLGAAAGIGLLQLKALRRRPAA